MTPQTPARRQENLAFCFQELLTVGERLRSYRQQVTDPYSFRQQLWAGIKQAEEEARRRGYAAEDIELAIFAVVAFLDESVLSLRLPVFADWPRQPLQEERYGHHIAGEIFFQNLQKLLGRSDNHELADLLEVYHLCLLLGFAGRYLLGGRGDLRGVIMQTAEKIQRVRQIGTEFSPWWRLPNDAVGKTGGDPWVKRLFIGLAASFALALILFIVFTLSLNSGVGNLQTIAGPVL
ncbi:MAG TPA: DotU family type IV/VI secretion system protein [Bryobacteraceae bacterium]|nr:DotU family type IV/VI secretion system protein [Bryobacteraceae bacterium]